MCISDREFRLYGSTSHKGFGRGSTHPDQTRLLPEGRGLNREVSFLITKTTRPS